MVEFIFEDLNPIAKKKKGFLFFLALKYSEMISSPVYVRPPLLSLNINSVEIRDSVSSLWPSDRHLAI